MRPHLGNRALVVEQVLVLLAVVPDDGEDGVGRTRVCEGREGDHRSRLRTQRRIIYRLGLQREYIGGGEGFRVVVGELRGGNRVYGVTLVCFLWCVARLYLYGL